MYNFGFRVTGGELFDEIVAREYYSETDARYEMYMTCRNEGGRNCIWTSLLQ